MCDREHDACGINRGERGVVEAACPRGHGGDDRDVLRERGPQDAAVAKVQLRRRDALQVSRERVAYAGKYLSVEIGPDWVTVLDSGGEGALIAKAPVVEPAREGWRHPATGAR